MALIDGVRDKFVQSLTNTNQHSRSKRTFSVNTEVVEELLKEYIDEYLDLYIPKTYQPDIHNIKTYLSLYLFTDLELEDILEEHSVSQKDFDKMYAKLHLGFKQLYEEEYA